MILIRKARVEDISLIFSLSENYKDLLLPLSKDKISEQIRDFFIAETEEAEGIGCVALHIYTAKLAEVRTLAIKSGWLRKGVGTLLTKQCIKEAKELGVERVFALTKAVPFFKSLGFVEISKDSLPEKVFKDCQFCQKYSCCDETAVIYRL